MSDVLTFKAEVLEAVCTPSSEKPTEEVLSARIKLNGKISNSRFCFYKDCRDASPGSFKVVVHTSHISHFYFDEFYDSKQNDEYFCFIIGSRWKKYLFGERGPIMIHFGLALVPDSSEEFQYQRIGYFEDPVWKPSYFDKVCVDHFCKENGWWTLRTITIV
jgi:hypothetical protein